MDKRMYLKVGAGVIIAAVLWFIIFIMKPLNFWLSMSCGISLLILTAFIFDKKLFSLGALNAKHLVYGIVSAIALYIVCYIGNVLSEFIVPMKDAQIAGVYMNRSGTNLFVISAALLFIIGPGEELFWRGFIQKILAAKFGGRSVVISSILYAAVHIVTLNFMLIMASLICGLFWGALYYKQKNLFPVIISHALWDITVFILLPFS